MKREGMANAAQLISRRLYEAVARALGGDGYSCRDREQLAQALAAALRAERFSVIACTFPRSAYDGRI